MLITGFTNRSRDLHSLLINDKAKIGLVSVARTNIKLHIDKYYCLVSVKAAWVFAKVFAKDSIIISQDNKAKVGLDVPVVGHTFKTIQLINKLVRVKDYNFVKENKIKLILSVYLLINPTNSNTNFCTGQFIIFIRPEYFIDT
ncbi:20364_t:CDS:2, partial [Gigaspora margarita]